MKSSPLPELEIKSILVVDDDPDLATDLKSILESRNFVVNTAPNGSAALNEVIAMDYDVIVCDLMMPHMAGDMFYLAVQKMKPALAKRFLFITGHSGNPKVEAFLEKIDGLALFKPVLSDELIRMISLVLKRSQKS